MAPVSLGVPEAATLRSARVEDGGTFGVGNEPSTGATNIYQGKQASIRAIRLVFGTRAPAAIVAVTPGWAVGASSARWPTREAMRWQPPKGFLQQAFCIHRHESVDWYRAYTDWQGNPSDYSGGMQFTLSTWQRAGGSGHPHEWRPREQVYRAWRIWRLYRTADRPGSWSEWGTRGKCGLA